MSTPTVTARITASFSSGATSALYVSRTRNHFFGDFRHFVGSARDRVVVVDDVALESNPTPAFAVVAIAVANDPLILGATSASLVMRITKGGEADAPSVEDEFASA